MRDLRPRLNEPAATQPSRPCAAPERDAHAAEFLKEVFRDDFPIGVALSASQLKGRDPDAIALVEKHFNSISPENLLKWEAVHPEPGRYEFGPADRFVAFGEARGMHIVGHTLVWFDQTPGSTFRDGAGKPLGREALLDRMREHIFTVMRRYKGRIHGWDVVNEALVDGRYRDSEWLRIIGEDYILKAFEYAREADPGVELYYNDFNLSKPQQREGLVRLIRDLQSHGIRIDGIGEQGHWGMDYPSLTEIEDLFSAVAGLGVPLMITELDVSVLPYSVEHEKQKLSSLSPELQRQLNPYADGLPDEVERAFTDRYAALFGLFRAHREMLCRITLWAVHDAQSWRNDVPVEGRTDYPMLFDRRCRPKPAFDAVIKTWQGVQE
jgi:endo-1,4-beta-xylanase